MAGDAAYLQQLSSRTLEETMRMLEERFRIDNTEANARLMLIYEEGGPFRRVVCRGLTMNDLLALIAAAKEKHDD